MASPIVYAVPFFLGTVIAEWWASARYKPGNYVTRDALASLTMGIGNLFVGIAFGAFHYACYSFFYEHRIFTMPEVWWSWVVLFFAEDLAYYWFHRVSHESRLWWAAHETHHSSRYYHLATALRQTWTSALHGWIFWAPLAWIGFSPEQIFIQQAISLLYQYWIHTRFINKMGVLEWVINTPSHHRVHHAIDVPYLDKNYAGILIIWDRMFGTFKEETFEPEYGVLKQLTSHNPFYIGFHAWVEMAKDVWEAPDWRSRLLYIVGRPGWRHDGAGKTVPQIQAEWEAAQRPG